MIEYWLSLIILATLSFIPGYVIANFLKFKDNEKFMLSFAFSAIFYIAILPILTTIPILAYAILAIFIALFIKDIKNFKPSPILIKLFILQLLFYSIISFILPYPVLGGDWFVHAVSQPLAFENGILTPPLDRPPLFSLLTLSFHKLVNIPIEQFWLSQIVSVIFNGLMWLPLFFIAKKYNEKIAKISALLVIMLPFITINVIYTWPKALAGYFILLFIYFLFFKTRNKTTIVLSALFAALAYLSHNYALLFIIPAFILLAIRKNYKTAITFLLITAIFLTPYFTWYYASHGSLSKSNFSQYPFAVNGYGAINNNTMQDFFNTPITTIIGNRIANTILTFTPAVPLLPLLSNASIITISDQTQTWVLWLHIYHTYIGALTLLLYILALFWFISYLKKRSSYDNTFVFIILTAFGLSAILWGWYELGLVHQTLQPTVPILTMLGLSWLYKKSDKKTMKIIVVLTTLIIITQLIFFMSGAYDYYITEDLPTLEISIQRFAPNLQLSSIVSSFHLIKNTGVYIILIIIHIMVLILISLKMFWREFENENTNNM